jgi:hypothetical protein
MPENESRKKKPGLLSASPSQTEPPPQFRVFGFGDVVSVLFQGSPGLFFREGWGGVDPHPVISWGRRTRRPYFAASSVMSSKPGSLIYW